MHCYKSSPLIVLRRYEGRQGVFPSAYLRKANTAKAKELLAMNKTAAEQRIHPARPSHPARAPMELSHYAPPRRDHNKQKPVRLACHIYCLVCL